MAFSCTGRGVCPCNAKRAHQTAARFGSALQLTPHFHALLPDGAFTEGADFVPLPPPSQEEVEGLLARVRRRVMALLAARGALEIADEGDAARRPILEMGKSGPGAARGAQPSRAAEPMLRCHCHRP